MRWRENNEKFTTGFKLNENIGHSTQQNNIDNINMITMI